MKRAWLPVLCAMLAAGVLLTLCISEAKAVKQYKDQFEAKYVKPDSNDSAQKALAEAAAKAKCLICHEGTSKKDRNRYGKVLAELLDRKKDTDDNDKIQAALDKAAAAKSDPADAKSPTFGELIKAGKLPGGEPKEQASH
jgi:hypothetical protein